MWSESRQAAGEPGEGQGFSESLLREAFRSGEDPEVTRFVESLAGVRAPDPTDEAGSWRQFVEAPGAPGELGRLDGHVLREVLAEGRMAVVFRAGESALDRTVALKMLAPGLAGNPAARERFLREAKAAAGLDHESALPIYRVGETPVPYFTMRHVAGGTLQERLDLGRRFSVAEWANLARQVAGALASAHAIGLTHRDIKPANLLFEGRGERLWVADFGIADSIGDPAGGGEGMVVGTPRYMSPEQARGGAVDGRGDLFSLGAVLYRCAAGEDLVPGETSSEVLDALERLDFASLALANAAIPAWQRRLLARLVASDPQDRFADAGGFLAALERETGRRSRSVRFAAMAAVAAVAITGFLAARPFFAEPPAAAVAAKPALPSIRIEGSEGVFRDFEAAFAAAPGGSTLLLDGVFVCRKTHMGPPGRRLTLRNAPGAQAVVVASRPVEHAIFLRGPTHLHGIVFIREPTEGNVMPVVGIYGGDAVVEHCRFEAESGGAEYLGSLLSFTHLENARIEACEFDAPGREAIAVAYDDGAPPTKVTVRDCIVVAGTAVVRRVWGGDGSLELEWERSAVAAERFFFEHPRNPRPPAPLSVRVRSSGLDLSGATLRFANGTRPDSGTAPLVGWQGIDNRYGRPGHRLEWSDPEAPDGGSGALVLDFADPLPVPLAGSELNARIAPFRSRGSGMRSLKDLREALEGDPEFSHLAADGSP